MKMLLRCGRFTLVGAMGMVVQLGALALFNHRMPGHYLIASATALELTLVHNFVWHIRYTWRDRQRDVRRLEALVRFHLSNGAISIGGNLGVMWVLVQRVHLPVLVANLIAIVCCSAANFCLGDRWAFAGRQGEAGSEPSVPLIPPQRATIARRGPRIAVGLR